MLEVYPPIEPVRARGRGASHAGPRRTHDEQAVAFLDHDGAALAIVASGRSSLRSGREPAERTVDTCTRIFRERTASMLDDLAEVWWRTEQGADEGARVRPFASLPIADRVALRDRVRSILALRVPDALGDVAVLEAETERLLELPRRALERVSSDFHRAAERDRRSAGTGATAVCAIFAAGRASIAHLGDCRALRIRHGLRTLEALTVEHTLRNDYAAAHPALAAADLDHIPKDVVSRALGMSDRVTVPSLSVALAPGDRFLFANAGLIATLTADEVRDALLTLGDSAAADLVDLARRDRPGHPGANVAAVAVEILGAG